MAHDSNQSEQTSPEKPFSKSATESGGATSTQIPQTRQTGTTPKRAQVQYVNRFDRSSSQRTSKVLASYPLDTAKETAKATQNINVYQPTKIFKAKCLAELKLLLESIKTNFHEEIKSLYQEVILTDLKIRIGDQELTKSYHKCLTASRAFKFFSILKAFKPSTTSVDEKDISVCEFQTQDLPKISQEVDADEDQSEKAKVEEELEDTSELLEIDLPKNILSSELLSNFFRRVYLDQDLTEEESRFNQLILEWLKIHRPETIKPQQDRRLSTDHRESFRTIQPNFGQLTLVESTVMSHDPPSLEIADQIQQSQATDSTIDEVKNTSQTNLCDESQTIASLTRTETFEMLAGKTVNSHLVNPPAEEIKTQNTEGPGDDEVDQSIVSDVNDSESSEPFVPVTRTGLKPKKFTTPIGMKSMTSCNASSKKVPLPSDSDRNPTSTIGPNKNTSVTLSTKQYDSLTSNKSSTPKNPMSNTIAKPKSTSGKPRQTIIARAHPISLERSQSPATGPARGTTKNFIAANKKLISQIERKIPSVSPQSDRHVNDESDNEASDTSLLGLTESLTTDNLATQLDKCSLISHSKLAEALARMFIEELLSDTLVLVQHHRQIRAHRCILAARSAYLKDEIGRQCLPALTAESSSTTAKKLITIDLTEFSHPAVYFSIMHIYTGVVKVPEDVELEELTKLSSLLHVSTLRQVCTHNLIMSYCHYFHKPCNVCCIGVLKTLPLAWRYDLTQLYSKCLQWIGSHFVQIFCLEEFANLKPNDLIEECYKETLTQLTSDSVIQKTIECQKLLKSLPRVKWTESIICLVGRLLEDFCHFVADNYEKVLQSESFLNLAKSCWECEVLEENLLAAMNHLRPDSGCRTLIQLDKIECSMETYLNEPRNISDTFSNLVSKMRKYCERYLLKEAAAVVHCSSWRQMNPSLQKRIKDQALIASDFDEPIKNLAAKPKLPSMARHHQAATSRSSPSPQPTSPGIAFGNETKSPSNRSTPDARLRSPNTTFLPPPKNKAAAARHVRVLK